MAWVTADNDPPIEIGLGGNLAEVAERRESRLDDDLDLLGRRCNPRRVEFRILLRGFFR